VVVRSPDVLRIWVVGFRVDGSWIIAPLPDFRQAYSTNYGRFPRLVVVETVGAMTGGGCSRA